MAEGPGRDMTFGEVTGAASAGLRPKRSDEDRPPMAGGCRFASPRSPPPHLAEPRCVLRVPGQRTTRTGQSAWWMTL